ncbi:hypothetical protein [Burkholderia cenocepacia]|uniref:hypothetical protein n=1 Tax=Burkholderia cenocepacia TaxID=95486 RepID=UPI0030F96829
MPNDNVLTEPRDAIARSKRILALVDEYHENPNRDTRTALRVALMDEFRPTAPDENAYVAKRLSEALADAYTTLVGDDKADADEDLNAIERVARAAQVIRLEVELYRAQAAAPSIADGIIRTSRGRAYVLSDWPAGGRPTDHFDQGRWADCLHACLFAASLRRNPSDIEDDGPVHELVHLVCGIPICTHNTMENLRHQVRELELFVTDFVSRTGQRPAPAEVAHMEECHAS